MKLTKKYLKTLVKEQLSKQHYIAQRYIVPNDPVILEIKNTISRNCKCYIDYNGRQTNSDESVLELYFRIKNKYYTGYLIHFKNEHTIVFTLYDGKGRSKSYYETLKYELKDSQAEEMAKKIITIMHKFMGIKENNV